MNKCTLRHVGSETGREAISPYSPFSSLYFCLCCSHKHMNTICPQGPLAVAGGEKGGQLYHFTSCPTLGPGQAERVKEAARRSPPLSVSPAGDTGGQPGAGAPAGPIHLPGPELACSSAERRPSGCSDSSTRLSQPLPASSSREGNSSWMSALPAGAAPGGAAAAAGEPHQQRPERRRAGGTPGCTAEPPRRPAPYQIVVLLIIAHEIILHVRHLGRRTGGGRRRGQPLLPQPRAALPNVAPLRPEPAAARASPAPSPGRSEPNPRRPVAGSHPLVATGPWQRRPGGAWALHAGTSPGRRCRRPECAVLAPGPPAVCPAWALPARIPDGDCESGHWRISGKVEGKILPLCSDLMRPHLE